MSTLAVIVLAIVLVALFLGWVFARAAALADRQADERTPR
jgi:hypothetical protein